LDITINDKSTFSVEREQGQLVINNAISNLDVSWQANGLVSVLLNGKSYTAIVEGVDRKTKEVTLRVNGQKYKANIKEPIDKLLATMGIDNAASRKLEPIKAPMPGMVLKVLVKPGQQIAPGDGLVILEAMKMENILKAHSAATVKAVKVNERTAVEKGTILIELE
jgi:biotin carboxyl carrier protein